LVIKTYQYVYEDNIYSYMRRRIRDV